MEKEIKSIVVLSDGTGNAASKFWRTNVWRLFQYLDLSKSQQVAFYDDGVGTSSFKPLAILGGAFGWGLKRNVLELYQFLCRNYEPGARIYAFGFSRGAFTIRVVMGLVASEGLIDAKTETDLDRLSALAYRAYRAKRYHSLTRVEVLFRAIRDVVVAAKDLAFGRKLYDSGKNIKIDSIHFIGLWDTVAAYGLPVDEMTLGVSKFLWPLELPDRTLSPKVTWARHAVALDDERTTFHPVLWTEEGEPKPKIRADGTRFIDGERLSQVWFSGVHSNVGGGYPDDSLAHVSLYWMMREAERCDLRLKNNALTEAKITRDKDGRLYDSRSGLGGYYRYGPRKLEQLCNVKWGGKGDRVKIAVPKIHESVFGRSINGAHTYAPIGLPKTYAVVDDNDQILEGPSNPHENPAEAQIRSDAQERVWNKVWWRRLVYFATIAASLHLVLFPLIHQTDRASEFDTNFRLVSETIRLAGAFIPNFFDWWLNSYAASPGKFVIGAVAVALLILIGVRLGSRITDQMSCIWKKAPGTNMTRPGGVLFPIRSSAPYQWLLMVAIKRQIVPFLSVVLIVYVVGTLVSHLTFNIADATGLYCKETKNDDLKDVPWLGTLQVEGSFQASDFCWASKVRLNEGLRYQVTITQASSYWQDVSPLKSVSYDTDMAGFEISELPTVTNRVFMVLGMPLRRVFLRPWFRIIGRIGAKGTDEYFMDPDKTNSVSSMEYEREISPTIRPRKTGELFLYVNDATFGWPWLADIFYVQNRGNAVVTIRHLQR